MFDLLEMDFNGFGIQVSLDEQMILKFWIRFNKFCRFESSGFDHFQVPDCFHTEVGDAPLLGAREYACSALSKVEFSELETVLGGLEGLEPVESFTWLIFGEDKTIWLMRPA